MINKTMFRIILFLSLVLFSNTLQSQIFINELDCDTPSIDDKEFIELKSLTPNFSLNGYILVLFNGTGSLVNKSYYVIDLDGFTTDINGIFVVGNNLVSPVPSKIIPENIFQNGPDGVGLYLGNSSDFPVETVATANNLVHALVYGTNDPDATSLMTLLGVSAQANESAGTGGSTVNSIQRKSDGTYESKTPTPNANNDGSGFIFNGIAATVSSTQINEGQSFTITFTTQRATENNLTFTFTLNNGSFSAADFTGSTTITIPTGTTKFTTTITTVDDVIDEGDEVLRMRFGSLPQGYNRLNDHIEIRVIDNDFITLPFGTPLNPTFGNITSTAPTDYYTPLEGLSGNTLKQKLQDIIADINTVRAHNYGDIIDILKTADQNPQNSNQVWLMYVEQPRAKLEFQTSSSNAGKWNREHIYPQSRGGFQEGTEEIADGINVWLPTNANDILTGHADAHHIRAEDGAENSVRSNKDFGLNDYNGFTGNKGSWKGDVARAIFYMSVRYNALNVINGNPADTTVGQMGDLATLLAWHENDPSDDFEMNRNNFIYTWQRNRNPFIDHPSLARYIFGENAGQPWSATLSSNAFANAKIIMYPNPATDHLIITGLESNATLQIFSVLGQKVFEKLLTSTTRIPINLKSGIYLAKITIDSREIVKKILIN